MSPRGDLGRRLRDVTALGGLSGLLLGASVPGFGLAGAAWVALLPLLLALRRTSPGGAFLAGSVTGIVYQAIHTYWLWDAGVPPAGHVVIVCVTGVAIGGFAALARVLLQGLPGWGAVTVPCAWVVFEYARLHVGWLSTPWGLLGYSQYELVAVTQVAAVAGVYGISFLIVAVNTALTELVLLRAASVPARVGLRIGAGLAAAAALWATPALLSAPTQTQPLKVALVQAGLYDPELDPERESWDVFDDYRRLTAEAAQARPQLVIWPESAVPSRLPADRATWQRLAQIARSTNSFLLVGVGGRDKMRAGQEREEVANSAFLFGPQGKMQARYDKIRLLPFNEYVPLRGIIAWPAWLAPDTAEAVAGANPTRFSLGEASFGVLICWENLFPGAARGYARQGVDFMVSITNETFTTSPIAREQLLATNVLRAVETGLSFVRAASTGVSAVIARDGRIVARVRDADGGDVDAVGYLTAEIPLGSRPTPYTRFGDAFVAAALGIVLVTTPLSLRTRHRSRHP